MINENKFNSLWTISHYAYAIVPIIIGIDKYLYRIVDWKIFVSPFVASMISPLHLIPLLGIIEISSGILLYFYPRLGSYLVAGLLSMVIVNLFLIGNMYDIILRDAFITFAYIMFALLTELKEKSGNGQYTHPFNNP